MGIAPNTLDPAHDSVLAERGGIRPGRGLSAIGPDFMSQPHIGRPTTGRGAGDRRQLGQACVVVSAPP
jgi:hypothetical protein